MQQVIGIVRLQLQCVYKVQPGLFQASSPDLDHSQHEFGFVVFRIELQGMFEVAYGAIVLLRQKETHAQLVEHGRRVGINLRRE